MCVRHSPFLNTGVSHLGLDHRAGHLADMSDPEYECLDTAQG